MSYTSFDAPLYDHYKWVPANFNPKKIHRRDDYSAIDTAIRRNRDYSDLYLEIRAHDILRSYTGYPDIPTGRPCGVLAYMLAHGKQKIEVPCFGSPSKTITVEAPYYDPGSSCPARPYYAVIETNPANIWVATLAKGAQDMIATQSNSTIKYELGQPRDLLKYLQDLRVKYKPTALANAEFDVNKLHLQLIVALLANNYSVRIESPFEAAVRETREEHGFDLSKSWQDVCHIDLVVESALSKRRIDTPVEHYLCVVEVSTFDTTLPSHSHIVEEKNLQMLGNTYSEYGVYLTLKEILEKLEKAEKAISSDGVDEQMAMKEIIATRSKAMLLSRIEDQILYRAIARMRGGGGLQMNGLD